MDNQHAHILPHPQHPDVTWRHGIGSYTWRYVMEPTATGTRLTESFDAERPLGSVMTWLPEKWTGSSDRDADLHDAMVTTLTRIKAAAEPAA